MKKHVKISKSRVKIRMRKKHSKKHRLDFHFEFQNPPKSTKKPSKNDVEKRLEKNSLQDPQKKSASLRSGTTFGPPSLGLPPFLIYNIHSIQRPARPSASRHPPPHRGRACLTSTSSSCKYCFLKF